MPMETNMNVGIRPIERPQAPTGTEGVQRRGDGGGSSGFSPRTNVTIQNAVDNMAGILSKISTYQAEGMERMPEDLQKVIQNVMKQAFSMEETLEQGIGSSLESQRFSMEQLTALSRMLTQMGNLVDKGYSLEISDGLTALLTNLKAYLTSQTAGNALEPVLINKMAFELLNEVPLEDMPSSVQYLLSSLNLGENLTLVGNQDENSLAFLKQLVRYFMPRPGGETATGNPAASGRANFFTPGQTQAQGAFSGQNQFIPSGQFGGATFQSQGGSLPSGAGFGANFSETAAPGQLPNQNLTQVATPASGEAPGQMPTTSGATNQNTTLTSQGQPTNPTNVPPQGANQNAALPESATPAQSGQIPTAPQGNQGGQGAALDAATPQGQGGTPTTPQGQTAPSAGQSPAPNASATTNPTTLSTNQSSAPAATPAQGQPPSQQSSPPTSGSPSKQAATEQSSGEQAASRTATNTNTPTAPATEAKAPQQIFNLMRRSGAANHQREFAPGANVGREPGAVRQAQNQFMRNTIQNTPQTMDTMRSAAALLLNRATLTPGDTLLLQDFVNGNETMLSDKEARQLQSLLRLCQQNVPATIQQAAAQQDIPDLTRLWAFMQLCDFAMAKRLNGRQLKSAGKQLAEFVVTMRHSMGGDNSSTVQGQRSLNFMLPIYMGENEKAYPTYIHVYDEDAMDPETGQWEKETWLRLCLLTDNIGAVEITCRVYNNTELDMRLFFSSHEVAEDFREYVGDFRDFMDSSELKLNDFKIGAVGERRFM
ncbi:MAG: hypothetical protein IJ849_00445 [Selenomonadaceae bacterium]|nr:hypothetical protein [Selenomonadaceae bacterium]